MAYSKLHSSIVQSSLWGQPDHVRLLFITLLALADQEGIVYGSKQGIARIANIDQTAEPDPWKVLLSPDPDSSDKMRAPENEGRRIEEISGGFRLLNYGYYRSLRNDDDRRTQNREAQRRYRERHATKPPSARVSHGKPQSAQAEAEAECTRMPNGILTRSGGSHSAVFDAWNAMAAKAGLPKAAGMSAKRVQQLKARLADPTWRDNWASALEKIPTTPFCLGVNDRGWRATFDWFLQPDSVLRLVEGKYIQSPNRDKASPSRALYLIEQREKALREERETLKRKHMLDSALGPTWDNKEAQKRCVEINKALKECQRRKQEIE